MTAVTLPPNPTQPCGWENQLPCQPPYTTQKGVRGGSALVFFYSIIARHPNPTTTTPQGWCFPPHAFRGSRIRQKSRDGGNGWLGVVVPQPHSGRSILAHTQSVW